jgi:hypothetical protein
MARLSWANVGERVFEAGIDRGVLYVNGISGVPWIGLISVSQEQSGGEAKPRYQDGIKIGNRTSPEQFEAMIEAFTYPPEFERCDGTYRSDNGLRITQQRRKPFGISYRSNVGNDVDGLVHGYKLHIVYNLKAQPSQRGYRTLSDATEPISFSWKVSSRAVQILGHRPTAHFIIDSRDVPPELLQILEDTLYGTETEEPTLPSPGELQFLFDSFADLVYDAGSPYTPVFVTYDAGSPSTPVLETIDGGAL